MIMNNLYKNIIYLLILEICDIPTNFNHSTILPFLLEQQSYKPWKHLVNVPSSMFSFLANIKKHQNFLFTIELAK